MTDQTVKQTVITPAADKTHLDLAEYGDRDQVVALGKRLQTMLPGNLTLDQALTVAQYAWLMDANSLRGEIYPATIRGRFCLIEGYKLLVRWAKRQCPYSERFEPMDPRELPEDAIGARCWILREDARPLLRDLIQGGATWREAFEIAATSAIGIVTKADRTTREGKPMDPPVSWTWQQVAEKRALKNALNRSHGAPSPREIAAMSWNVNGTRTIQADWEDCSPGLPAEARERLAEQKARARLAPPDPRTPEQVLAAGNALLHQSELQI
ncbi:MAG TPA: hypothetical protein VMX14_13240 [Anaerolineae bacterium]|nr:hypothetical protein [Anaerolineae bacterium]